MRSSIYVLFLQCLILGNKWRHSNAKAMIGHEVRSALENEFPYVVCILKYSPLQHWDDNLLCTGTLLSPTHVLTAEHCFHASQHYQIEVTVGGHNVDDGVRYYPIWWISYNQWMTNTNQLLDDLFNDILISKIFGLPISLDVQFSMGYLDPTTLNELTVFNVVGCGKVENNQFPAVLKTSALTYLRKSLCIDRISNLVGSEVYLADKYLCSHNNPYTLLNDGDSGGPLIFNGVLVGMSIAVCPNVQHLDNADQINIHLSFHYYYNFIRTLIAPGQ